MKIFDEIKEILAKELAIDKELVTQDAHLQDDLDADSIALVTLAEILGNRYKLKLSIDDLIDAETVGELVQIIESKLS
jgi:acyl carrier protein